MRVVAFNLRLREYLNKFLFRDIPVKGCHQQVILIVVQDTKRKTKRILLCLRGSRVGRSQLRRRSCERSMGMYDRQLPGAIQSHWPRGGVIHIVVQDTQSEEN